MDPLSLRAHAEKTGKFRQFGLRKRTRRRAGTEADINSKKWKGTGRGPVSGFVKEKDVQKKGQETFAMGSYSGSQGVRCSALRAREKNQGALGVVNYRRNV